MTKSIEEHRSDMLALCDEVEELIRFKNNIIQDNCENAYVEATLYNEENKKVNKLTISIREALSAIEEDVGNLSVPPIVRGIEILKGAISDK